MKNRKWLMLAVALVVVLLVNSCGGLFLSSEAENLVGFWESEPWSEYGTDNCYYDFRADGRVYVTEWTASFPFYNNWMVPVPISLNYSISNGNLTMSQYFGFVNFEFEVSDTSSDIITLTVLESTGNYNYLDYGSTITLTRILEPSSREAAAAIEFLQEYGNE